MKLWKYLILIPATIITFSCSKLPNYNLYHNISENYVLKLFEWYGDTKIYHVADTDGNEFCLYHEKGNENIDSVGICMYGHCVDGDVKILKPSLEEMEHWQKVGEYARKDLGFEPLNPHEDINREGI